MSRRWLSSLTELVLVHPPLDGHKMRQRHEYLAPLSPPRSSSIPPSTFLQPYSQATISHSHTPFNQYLILLLSTHQCRHCLAIPFLDESLTARCRQWPSTRRLLPTTRMPPSTLAPPPSTSRSKPDSGPSPRKSASWSTSWLARSRRR